MGAIDRLNSMVAESAVGRFFQVKERNTTFTQELRSGLVTFLTVAYILAVNANIVTNTGGMCVVDGTCKAGIPPAFQSDDCQACITKLRASLISATAAACVISHFLMGVIGNLPLAVCPAMGLNAYFTYTVVGFMGSGRVAYNAALSAVFIEGFIFMLVTILGVRSKLVELIPRSIMLATSAGIGLFLAFIGMQASEGLGVATYNSATLVTLGGCAPQYRTNQYTIPGSAIASVGAPDSICYIDSSTGNVTYNGGLFVPSDSYSCSSAGVMRSATLWLGIAGGMLMTVLMAKNAKGAIMVGILFVTFISWIPTDGNKARYIENPDGCQPNGQYADGASCLYTPEMRRWDYFKKVVSAPDTSATAGKFDFSGFKSGDLWIALITFLYVDFLDATGTFYSMANFLSNYIPGFVDQKKKRFPRQTAAFMVDGASISIGACLGTPPLTVYIESASGIREGARTGIATLMVGFCFFIALFFSPLLATVPPYATGPALILVGALMMINIVKVPWDRVGEAVPAFLTIVVMPFTYSVAYGFIAGIIGYIIINWSVFAINYVETRFFPGTAEQDSTLTHAATWKIVLTKTFNLIEDEASEGSDSGKEASTHGMPAGHEIPAV
ncbi:hypothetical protein ABPG75_011541 [Micractinium tetrahymenae]